MDERNLRDRVALAFARFEDVVYVGLGILLAFGAAALLILAIVALFREHASGQAMVLDLLDRSLLILMFVELLYTVQVSFRSH